MVRDMYLGTECSSCMHRLLPPPASWISVAVGSLRLCTRDRGVRVQIWLKWLWRLSVSMRQWRRGSGFSRRPMSCPSSLTPTLFNSLVSLQRETLWAQHRPIHTCTIYTVTAQSLLSVLNMYVLLPWLHSMIVCLYACMYACVFVERCCQWYFCSYRHRKWLSWRWCLMEICGSTSCP